MTNVMLHPFPNHLPLKHFRPQNFPHVELRRSLATCSAEDDAGYGLFLLSYVPAGDIISWYSKDIISKSEANELQARGNKYIRIVRQAKHCLNSQPLLWRDSDYYAACHELAGFANASNFLNAFFVDVGNHSILVPFHDINPGPNGTEIFVGYNF